MNPVENFIDNTKDETLRETMEILRHFILSTDDRFQEKISYGIPFFYMNRNICYLNPTRRGLDLGFVKGYRIQTDFPGFELLGRKQVKTFHYNKPNDINFISLDDVLKEAIKLDKK